MKRTRTNSWILYAAAGLVVTVVLAGIISSLLGGMAAKAVWFSAAVAYVIQITAFALLLYMRNDPNLFLSAWLGGMVIRFAVLGVATYGLSRSAMLPRGATLLSFVGFVFLLLLLEPVFLRWDLRG